MTLEESWNVGTGGLQWWLLSCPCPISVIVAYKGSAYDNHAPLLLKPPILRGCHDMSDVYNFFWSRHRVRHNRLEVHCVDVTQRIRRENIGR